MVDLHSHILPGMDDGSRSAEESHKMLLESARQGVSVIAATPHYYPAHEDPESFLKRREASFSRLEISGEMPRVVLGAEVAYFYGISRCDALESLGIQGTGLILLELPFGPWSNTLVSEVCSIKPLTGLTPVIAHIERYSRNRAQLSVLRSAGVLMQSNAESFLSRLSSRGTIKAFSAGKTDFLGSDCHDLLSRAPNMGSARDRIVKYCGREFFDRFDAATAAYFITDTDI